MISHKKIITALPKTTKKLYYTGEKSFLLSLKNSSNFSIISSPSKEASSLFFMALHIIPKDRKIEFFNSIKNTAKEYFFIDYSLVNRNTEYIFSWYKYIKTYFLFNTIYPHFKNFMQAGALEGFFHKSPFLHINTFRFHKAQISLYHCKDTTEL